jgi:alkylation response protein AidB-like acyl-CoA dehydrogenase
VSFDHAAIAREVKERFGDFFDQQVNPSAAERDRLGETFPVEMLREMAKLGLIGFTAPAKIGGAGRTWEQWGHTLEEIGYQCDDSGLPMLLSYRETAINLLYNSGLEDGKAHLIERYAKPAVRGDAFIGWVFTEEGGGFPLAVGKVPDRPRTTLLKRGDRWLLNGSKEACTGGLTCTSWIVYAATEDGSDTVVIMVERDDPGVEVIPLPSLGLRSMGLAELHFKDVELSADRIVAAKDGISHGQIFVNERRVTGAAWLLGRMRALMEKIIDDAAPKFRLGRPVLDFDTFQAGIGRMYLALEAARSTAYRTFAEVEADREDGSYVYNPLLAAAKYVSTASAVEVATIAQQLAGGNGFFCKYGIERFIRDFHGLVPIVGTPTAIEAQQGAREIYQQEMRRRNR